MSRQNKKTLQELDLLDRFLFAEAMEDSVIRKSLIDIVLGKEINFLGESQTEKEIRISPLLRAIRMDVFTTDADRTVYNTEMQKRDTGNLPKRSRFYQALLDSSLLEPGVVDFNLLNDCFLITIAPFDILGLGKYRYTFRMTCEEYPDLQLKDGATRIFLNTQGRNPADVSPEFVELMNYIEHTSDAVCEKCESAKIKEMHKRICKIKASEEIGVRYMNLWEERILDKQEARAEGLAEGQTIIAKNLLKLNLPLTDIAAATQLPITEVEKLQSSDQ